LLGLFSVEVALDVDDDDDDAAVVAAAVVDAAVFP
jgi:hypothetical protein